MMTGHIKQRKELQRLLNQSRVPSAILLVGKRGVGKSKIALEYFTQLLCSSTQYGNDSEKFGGCGACSSCLLIAAGNHPDWHWIDAAQEEWNTSAIRSVLSNLAMASYTGGKGAKVVVVDHAESLHISAANLLLKNLEEPQPLTYFVLVCSSLMSLPVTVRSRCHVIQCGDLLPDEMTAILQEKVAATGMGLGASPYELQNKLRKAIMIADGSVVTALHFLTMSLSGHEKQNKEHLSEDIETDLLQISRGDTDKACTLAKKLASFFTKNKEALPLGLSLLRSLARVEMYRGADARKWGNFLANTVDAETIILERYITPEHVLLPLFIGLATSSDTRLKETFL
jgi:DNA polymerase III delta prime subunit